MQEPLPGIEPGTPSLPWKCSTPELKRPVTTQPVPNNILPATPRTRQPFNAPAGAGFRALGPMSGRRGSNPRPSAWKADALPTELHPPGSSNGAAAIYVRCQTIRRRTCFSCGQGRIRTSEGVSHQIYSLDPLTAWATRPCLPAPHRAPCKQGKIRQSVSAAARPAQENWMKSWRRDSNPQPVDYKSTALPVELRQQAPHYVLPRTVIYGGSKPESNAARALIGRAAGATSARPATGPRPAP